MLCPIGFSSNRRILVVDNYPPMAEAYGEFLPKAWRQSVSLSDKVDVVQVRTKDDAQRRLAEQDPFDLVVTANKVPVLGDGLALIRYIQQSVLPRPKVLMVSGDVQLCESTVKEAGGDGFISGLDIAMPQKIKDFLATQFVPSVVS